MASATEAPATSEASCPALAATTELDTTVTELQDPVKQPMVKAHNMVKLNVGGTIFETSKDTLLRVEGSYFHALLGSGNWKPDDDTTNAYCLDMDPTLFRRVLVYLRTGSMMPMDGLTKADRDELMAMMEYLKVCPWEVWTQIVRWNATNKSSTVTLSNECRTVEKTTYEGSGGAVATEALDGTFRIRVDVLAGAFFVGLSRMAGFDCTSWAYSPKHCYCVHHNGYVHTMQRPELRPELRVGDVVTIKRSELEVIFTVNDDAPVRAPLVDPNEALFPMVFMSSMAPGTKVTIVD